MKNVNFGIDAGNSAPNVHIFIYMYDYVLLLLSAYINTRAAFIIFYWCHLCKYRWWMRCALTQCHAHPMSHHWCNSNKRERDLNEEKNGSSISICIWCKHIALFVIGSVRKWWNEYFWERNLRIEKRHSVARSSCDYEECIMLTFFRMFVCSSLVQLCARMLVDVRISLLSFYLSLHSKQSNCIYGPLQILG